MKFAVEGDFIRVGIKENRVELTINIPTVEWIRLTMTRDEAKKLAIRLIAVSEQEGKYDRNGFAVQERCLTPDEIDNCDEVDH